MEKVFSLLSLLISGKFSSALLRREDIYWDLNLLAT